MQFSYFEKSGSSLGVGAVDTFLSCFVLPVVLISVPSCVRETWRGTTTKRTNSRHNSKSWTG